MMLLVAELVSGYRNLVSGQWLVIGHLQTTVEIFFFRLSKLLPAM